MWCRPARSYPRFLKRDGVWRAMRRAVNSEMTSHRCPTGWQSLGPSWLSSSSGPRPSRGAYQSRSSRPGDGSRFFHGECFGLDRHVIVFDRPEFRECTDSPVSRPRINFVPGFESAYSRSDSDRPPDHLGRSMRTISDSSLDRSKSSSRPSGEISKSPIVRLRPSAVSCRSRPVLRSRTQRSL
jgi:hypothetical protein